MAGRGGPSPQVAARVKKSLRTWMAGRLPGTVAAYLAIRGEVDVAGLFTDLPGWRWALPRLETDDTLVFRDHGAPRERYRFGIEQPVAGGVVIPVHEIDLFLVPGVAFDLTGRRLGRGGGHYDRVLAGRRADSTAVGVTYRDRLVDDVPWDRHDQRMDWLAIEDEVIECRPTR